MPELAADFDVHAHTLPQDHFGKDLSQSGTATPHERSAPLFQWMSWTAFEWLCRTTERLIFFFGTAVVW
jgi:hypothetical protein